MRVRRSWFILFACILTLSVLAGCAPAGAASATGSVYKIGFNSSATGASASLGLPEAKTAQMLQKQINDLGGIVGPDGVRHPVTIVIYDDKTANDQTVSNVTRLISEDEVVAVVSGTSSGASVAEVPVCQENKTACISMATANAIIFDPKTAAVFPWMFKLAQTNAHAGEWQAAYLKAKAITDICILYSNDGYGKDTLTNFQATAEAQGFKLAYTGSFAATDTEFSAQIASVQASGCKAVEIGATPPVASLVTIAVRTAMPEMVVTSGHGVCNQSFISTAGQAAEGVVFPCGKVTVVDQIADNDPQKKILQKYIADYQAFTNGDAISTFGGHAWDGISMITEALGSLKEGMSLTDQRAAVRDYLEMKISQWPGVTGVFTFSPTDHNGLTKDALLFVKVQNGKWVAFPQKDW